MKLIALFLMVIISVMALKSVESSTLRFEDRDGTLPTHGLEVRVQGILESYKAQPKYLGLTFHAKVNEDLNSVEVSIYYIGKYKVWKISENWHSTFVYGEDFESEAKHRVDNLIYSLLIKKV